MELEDQCDHYNQRFSSEQSFGDYSNFKNTFSCYDSYQNNFMAPIYGEECVHTQTQMSDQLNQTSTSFPNFNYHLTSSSMDAENEKQEEEDKKTSNNNNENIITVQKKDVSNGNNKKKKVVVANIINKIKADDSITLQHGLTISSDGYIRFQYSIGQVSFGFCCHQIHSVAYKKNDQLIQIIKYQAYQPNKVSVEEAIKFLSQTSCYLYKEASSALLQFTKFKDTLQSHIHQIPVNNSLIEEKEDEMTEFEQQSQEYIKHYSDIHGSEIFSYGIGRLNLSKRDMEFKNVGYSKSFLDLIGVDIENFCSILLRQQRIDLCQDKDEIMRSSIFGLNQQLLHKEHVQISYNIVTFDGFPLRIHSKKKLYALPNFQYKQLLHYPCEYLLQITTIDVELQDLQNLIQYRERLLYNSNQLSFDDFIKKELSYMFEDVEYSVYAQQFIEKHYNQNLIYLHQIEEEKIKKEKQVQKKYCNIKTLDNNEQSKPIQIIFNQ